MGKLISKTWNLVFYTPWSGRGLIAMKYSYSGPGAGRQDGTFWGITWRGTYAIQLRYYISILLMPWLAHYRAGGQSVGSQMERNSCRLRRNYVLITGQ